MRQQAGGLESASPDGMVTTVTRTVSLSLEDAHPHEGGSCFEVSQLAWANTRLQAHHR